MTQASRIMVGARGDRIMVGARGCRLMVMDDTRVQDNGGGQGVQDNGGGIMTVNIL